MNHTYDTFIFIYFCFCFGMHRFINILLNNCDYINDKLASEKRYQDACRDPTMGSGLELKRQFVAPLAKRVSSFLVFFFFSLASPSGLAFFVNIFFIFVHFPLSRA